MMEITRIPDCRERIARHDAFWHGAVIDRPVVCMALPKEQPERPWPTPKPVAHPRERWMDTAWVVDRAVAAALNTDYLGDALPTAWPNLGPEVFSAFFGMEMEYTEGTSWGIPCLEDWSQTDQLQFSETNPYWRKLIEMTNALLEAGQGIYYVGLTDLHPGGDAVAAFRDPQILNLDLLEHPQGVKELLDRVTRTYFDVFDFFYNKLAAAEQAITTWLGIVSSKKWYVPSNDFSCMVGKEMFDDFFLPGIVEECRHMDASVYHLDGPGALHHLDSLLAIDELNAIQWVYGAGNGPGSKWMDLYRKCQDAGKGVLIYPAADELECFIEHLRPEGVWMSVGGVKDRDHADAILRRLSQWT